MLSFCRIFILALILLFSVDSYGQKKRPPVWPWFSAGYIHQKNNNLFVSLGAAHLLKRHTYVALLGGPLSYKYNNKRYYNPNFSFEYFYQTKSKLGMGPMFTVNYTRYKFDGIKNNCISIDAGWTIFFFTIFGGYNYSLAKKIPEQITPFRVGIKYP